MKDRKIKEAEFTKTHTLTPQDLRKMILKKFERATAYHNAEKKRKREIAQEQL